MLWPASDISRRPPAAGRRCWLQRYGMFIACDPGTDYTACKARFATARCSHKQLIAGPSISDLSLRCNACNGRMTLAYSIGRAAGAVMRVQTGLACCLDTAPRRATKAPGVCPRSPRAGSRVAALRLAVTVAALSWGAARRYSACARLRDSFPVPTTSPCKPVISRPVREAVGTCSHWAAAYDSSVVDPGQRGHAQQDHVRRMHPGQGLR